MREDDFMEIGESGLVARADGWFFDKNANEMIDPEGRRYDKFGELVHDPTDEG